MSQAQVRDSHLQHCVTSLVSLQHQVLPALLSSFAAASRVACRGFCSDITVVELPVPLVTVACRGLLSVCPIAL